MLIRLIPDKSWHQVFKQLCGIVFVCILDSFQHIHVVCTRLWVVGGKGEGECVVYLLVVMGTVIVLSGFYHGFVYYHP